MSRTGEARNCAIRSRSLRVVNVLGPEREDRLPVLVVELGRVVSAWGRGVGGEPLAPLVPEKARLGWG
jgi:hypothetical protein